VAPALLPQIQSFVGDYTAAKSLTLSVEMFSLNKEQFVFNTADKTPFSSTKPFFFLRVKIYFLR